MAARNRMTCRRLLWLTTWWLPMLLLAIARAELLPTRLYTAADGLASSDLRCVVRDSHGLLWFCSAEGLTSFDGYTFTKYGVSQGLPDAQVSAFLEARDGSYWVLTATAISRFFPETFERNRDSDGGPRFFEVNRFPPDIAPRPRALISMAEASDGRIWCLTTATLFRFDPRSKQLEAIDTGQHFIYMAMFQDGDGSLWLGSEFGLSHRLNDGRMEEFGTPEGLPTAVGTSHTRVGALLRDRDGTLWVGTWVGLCRMSAHSGRGKESVERVYTRRDGLADNVIEALFQAHDGTIWVATEFGISRFVQGSGKTAARFRTYTARRGLNLPDIGGLSLGPFAEDRRNNLWIVGRGAMRLAANGLTTYTVDDGLATNDVQAFFEDRQGRLIAVSGDPRARFLNVFDGDRFVAVKPWLAKGNDFTWGHGQIHFQDHTGAWWVATAFGVYRYTAVSRVEDLANRPPDQVIARRDGLPGDLIYALFEDSRGDVWISVIGPNVVTLWSRATGSLRNFANAGDGRPLGTPTAFAEDHAGNVWMNLYWHDVARYRNGQFDVFTSKDGLPQGVATSLLVDHAGRLWIGTSHGGLVRVDDPAAAHPRFSIYTTRSGLSSDSITCITEDLWGRIYVGTRAGIDRLDEESGHVKHFNEAAGVRFGLVSPVAYRDRQGALWFGSERLMPEHNEESTEPPAIRITGIRVRGTMRSISAVGERSIVGLRLKPTENQIQIDFASLNFGIGETIRYQYKLEGSQKDWSPPADTRSVNFEVLSPGSYRFLVRAITEEGLASPAPAMVEFRVLPPIWMRWWFWTAALAALTLAAIWFHRFRLRQALELERVRTRIATDLHDDIGSSLAQIVVLSEVMGRKMTGEQAADSQLARIADLARELVGSMSDIVWSINPQRDHLSDLTQRMRRFAGEVLTARDIEFEFTSPEAGDHTAVRAEVRRQAFLIYKECIHNILRHSGSRHVEVALKIDQRRLVLRIDDDGRGFDGSPNGQGHGLSSMKQRAQAMGGLVEIHSTPGSGTSVTLNLPLDAKPVRRATNLHK